ncbi:sporulation delaying protein family toxin [Bacillus siamensis]|uniref:sporulation delaying protein family toxin n=1 Tax=Bacillus siamensis TaxID=659243 RepID=UPI0002F768DB|nr:sporulation delaying protein family toxin [Bacillus siamensis]MED0771232.1 sporulation delaying protein family toxin [Bacillus siamensis]MED0774277.1 sporulation delaying protein family toxin [Bacillus siamensis]MED0779211.1 sporulation delaying protein family toxin [Bacillus siamensis]MED0833797.1 sporulation delaying protein family toxin [Bacillus siamensis]MED5047920.1 sporulation delaying protein family toxin [Bacillus siamensis]
MVKSKRSAAAMLLVFVLMIALVGPHATAKTKPAVSYSGEDIFSGIFFGQGEVAKLLPEVWDTKAVKKINQDELKQVSDQVIADIKKSSPDYFKKLKAAVYSGDYEKVNSVIDQGSQIMAKVLKEEFDKKSMDKGKSTAIGQCATAVWVFLNAAAAIETIALAVAAIILTVASVDEDSDLGKEQLIANVVDRINAQH